MSEKFTAHEKRVLGIACYGHFLSHFNMLVFPAIALPLTEVLGMNLASVLGLSFWMYLLFGITALPWGLIADRWNAKGMFVIFNLGVSVCALIAALNMDSPTTLMLALAGVGLFSGIYHPVGLGWLSRDVRDVSMALGYNGMFGNLGLAIAPLLGGLFNWLWGVQAVYLIVGAMNFLGVLFLLRSSSPSHEEKLAQQKKKTPGSLSSYLIMLVSVMLGGITYRGMVTVTPAWLELKTTELFRYLESFVGYGLTDNLIATSIASFIFMLGIGGQYAGGKLAGKYDTRIGYLVFHCITIPAVFGMFFVQGTTLIVLMIIYFLFLLGMQPFENTLIAGYVPEKIRHSAFGLKFICSFGVGSLAVKAVEFIERSYDLSMVFPMFGFATVLLVCAILVLIFHTRRKKGVDNLPQKQSA